VPTINNIPYIKGHFNTFPTKMEVSMNRKGFTGIETIIAIGVIGLIIGIFGKQTIASLGDLFNGGNKNQTKQVHKIDEKYTIGRLDARGHFVKIGDYAKKED
jgi:hypothetical protein